MKVGKKALSCLLAIMMIVSSCSVCFSVLGATTDTKDIYNAIVMHYDSLMDAIDKATVADEAKRDTSGVPVKNGSVWEIKKDTLNGGWLAVSRAIASYAKGTVGTNKTYVDLVDAIKAVAAGYAGSNGHPVADYNAILEYYKFGSTATGTFASQDTVTLNIGTGFDLLAFKDVASIVDKTYSTAVLKFTPKGELATGYTLSTADDISFTTTDFIEPDTDVAAIKGVLEQCIAADAFKTWFNKATLTTDDLAAMTQLLALFDTTMAITGLGYTEAEIWDYYVAPEVSKTYAETKAWYDAAGARAEAEPKAVAYKTRLDALMATDLTAMDAAGLFAHRQSVQAVVNEIENDQFSTLVITILNEKEANYYGANGYKVESYLKELGLKIAQAYAPLFADQLVQLATEADTLKTSKDVELAEGQTWESTPEYAAALAWVTAASDLISDIDSYVLDGASFADIAECKSANGNAITEALYKKVADEIGVVSLDIYGTSYLEDKAAMDKIMTSTILTGRSYNTIYEIAEEFRLLYNKAAQLRDDATMQAVYAAIYPDGIEEYATYLNTMKAAAAQSYYDTLAIVDAYYSEGGSVKYYNFEGIIARAESTRNTSGTYATVATFLNSTPAYVPDAELEQIKAADISALYNKIFGTDGYYNKAVAFRTGLNNLRNLAYQHSNEQTADKKILSYILRQENVTGSQYGWESCIGSVSVDKIREFVNEIELVQQTGIQTSNGKITAGGIEDLMTLAVEDLDKILISNDLGTLLNSLTAKENEETGATVGFLGVWGFDYTFKNPGGGTTTVKAGDPCKNLREFLINLVVGLLWGGSLQTTLFTALNGAVGPAVYNIADTNGQCLSVVSAKKSLWQWLPEITQRAIPTMPHLYYEDWNGIDNVAQTDGANLEWYKYFTGEAFKMGGNSEYDYTMILKVLQKAPLDRTVSNQNNASGTREIRSYWAPFKYNDQIARDDCALLGTYSRTLPYTRGYEITQDKTLNANLWTEGEDQLPFCNDGANCTNPDHYFNSKKAWHINDWNDFYRTFAVATCGLHVPLAELMTKKALHPSDAEASNLFAEADIASINASVITQETGDALYDRLFIPLYRLLGIEGFYNASTNPGGYYGYDKIREASQTWAQENNMGVKVSGIYNSGVPLWTYVLQPIVYWLENELFVRPVQTIAELLPNLLTMLEYDQLRPKLSNISLYIGYTIDIASFIGGKSTDLSLSGIILPLLTGLGITQDALKGGISGLLSALLGGVRTTNPNETYTDEKGNTVAYKYLMKVTKEVVTDEFGNKVTQNVTSTTEKAQWKASNGTTYYIKTPGLLTATLYGLMIQEDDPETSENETLENPFLDWIFMKGGNTAQVPLQIPVNRFMAAGSLKGGDHPNNESTSIAGVYGSVTNYHIYAEPGVSMLVLLRWLLNDGTLDVLMPLLSGLIKPTVDPETGEESSILDTIIPIIDGQADNLMAIIICLLNDYVITAEKFQDPAQDTSAWGKYNAEGTGFDSYLNENGTSKFAFGTILRKYLSEGNANVTELELTTGNFTDADLTAKADLAVANADKLINSLATTLFVALKDTLLGIDAIRDLGFEAVIEKMEKSINDPTAKKVTLEDVVTDTVIGNNLVDIIMNLVFGNGLPTKAKLADGTQIQAHTDGQKMSQTYTDGQGVTKTTEYYITAGSDSAPLAYDEKGDVEIVRQVKYALDADGNETDRIEGFVVNEGLLGGLFGDPESILNKVLDALGDFNLDISPVGFYDIWTS
ncbi:MAG: hypothetical protein IJV68_06735, partial [Clostridia bacterium]|nr:hypothetical protein [Clostridia bacterium]